MTKINSAESIRGLACLVVVFSHIILTFFPGLHYLSPEEDKLPNYNIFTIIFNSPITFFYSGNAAVYVFFALSGFVLSYAILESDKNTNHKIFLMTIKRYPRLAIPALVSCLLAWIVFHLNIDTSTASHWISRMGSYGEPITYAIYDALINAFVFGKSKYNWVLWTMQLELLGSFVVFSLVYIKINFKNTLFFISSLFLLIGTLVLSIKLGLGIFCFLFGMYMYMYGFKINNTLASILLILGLYFAGVHNDSISYNFLHKFFGEHIYSIISVLSGPMIVYSVLMNNKFSEFLNNKILVFFGKLSFSLYLIHMLVIYSIGIPVFNYMNNIHINFLFSAFFSSALILLVSFIFSVIYSKYIDYFSINVCNKIK